MTPNAFRRLALALADTIESAHGGHPDFRRDGRIFATLGSPNESWAMVKLDAEQQAVLVAAEPALFMPAKGAWGRRGSTLVRLEDLDETTARSALAMAWENLARRRAKRR